MHALQWNEDVGSTLDACRSKGSWTKLNDLQFIHPHSKAKTCGGAEPPGFHQIRKRLPFKSPLLLWFKKNRTTCYALRQCCGRDMQPQLQYRTPTVSFRVAQHRTPTGSHSAGMYLLSGTADII